MDTIWTRRSNTSKLSLSTGNTSTNGGPPSNDHPPRNFSMGRRHGDSSSHGNKNPFNTMSPSTSLASPTVGASSAFGLGSGAFASFGSAKTPKTPGGAADFGGAAGGGTKTPVTEKSIRDLGTKVSKASLTDSKNANTSPSHPLRHSWVFWFRPPISKSNGFVEYEKTLHPMAAFSTAEDFFQVYTHLKRPSSLPLVSDYHLFKKGIRPIWEDDDNKKGGKWIVRLKKGVADRYWEELVLAIVGDQFADTSDEVCGAVLSVRNGEDILSIWTRDDSGRVLKIKETMKRILGFPPDTKIEWKSHDSSLQQRREIDEARKDKSSQHNHPSSTTRNGDHSSPSDKKQNS
ncbi:Eukaryotic translation initiation factor 4E type 2 [Hyphodiscus hymeniophilus]|uniref:Eukaryotic translation initiation factor 4E type 2 n=1 Tax=Hyphodiscus hymeniophilus TaxID=353542 RepID=A0A9P7AU47_9HELO|nr:Eukaryotic translation initiation factor 4E type 2 [Hyphodiscus hymeniophilus]